MATDRRREGGFDGPAAAFELSPDPVLVHETDGTVSDANDAAAELFDRTRERLRGTTAADLWQTDVGEDPALVQRAVDTGSASGERRLHGDGETRWIEVTARRAETDPDCVVTYVRELTDRRKLELDLRRERGVVERALDSASTGILVHDADGAITVANDRAAAILGLDRDVLLGTGFSDRRFDVRTIDGDSLAVEELPFARIRSSGEPISDERVTVETPAGAHVLSVGGEPLWDGDGEFDGAVVSFEDVTERAERERRLEENDAILTQLTETTDDVFWLFDDEFSEVQFVNDAYEDVWGLSIADLHEDSMSFLEGVHPDDREMVQDAIERLLAGESTDIEYRVDPTVDYQRWVWVRGEPLFDDAGEVERVAGFARDITERKERERDLERKERQFEAVFNDPQLLVGLLDTDGTIRRVNESALSHAETGRDGIEGTPFPETPWWAHDETLQDDLRQWLASAADGEYVEFEAEHPVAGGDEIHVAGTIRPVTDGDGVVRSLIASSRDVTERKERERQLEESNARLEKFAYVASHDLQEPLRTVSNYVELIAEEYADDLDEEAREFVDVVVTGSERMQSMINGLLDYSRVTTRGNEFEPVDTEQVVRDVERDLDLLVANHDGTLQWGDLPTVEADGDQLRQVVQNLVKNALEHSGSDPVDIEVRATETGDSYRFEVEDDGPGIEPNRQEKIFRIFKSGTQYQTSSQAKGIGLAICENIVQRHGGEIWVESEPGEGATFVFTIRKQQ